MASWKRIDRHDKPKGYVYLWAQFNTIMLAENWALDITSMDGQLFGRIFVPCIWDNKQYVWRLSHWLSHAHGADEVLSKGIKPIWFMKLPAPPAELHSKI